MLENKGTIEWANSLREPFSALSQDLLTRHKLLVAEFLEQNYDIVSTNDRRTL